MQGNFCAHGCGIAISKSNDVTTVQWDAVGWDEIFKIAVGWDENGTRKSVNPDYSCCVCSALFNSACFVYDALLTPLIVISMDRKNRRCKNMTKQMRVKGTEHLTHFRNSLDGR